MNAASTRSVKKGIGFALGADIVKTTGIVLQIRPYSRTSHVVTWLTPDHGPVSTLVKGAVRPKSAFLGQYDFFYTCEVLYYARTNGTLHPLREAVARQRRDGLRGRWRETALAGYAADLVRELAPQSQEAAGWYDWLIRVLDELSDAARMRPLNRQLVAMEMGMLGLAGLVPDFSGMDKDSPWTSFAIDLGRCGEGERTVRLAPAVVAAMRGAIDGDYDGAIRFLGFFLAYHLERSPDIRRSLVAMLN